MSCPPCVAVPFAFSIWSWLVVLHVPVHLLLVCCGVVRSTWCWCFSFCMYTLCLCFMLFLYTWCWALPCSWPPGVELPDASCQPGVGRSVLSCPPCAGLSNLSLLVFISEICPVPMVLGFQICAVHILLMFDMCRHLLHICPVCFCMWSRILACVQHRCPTHANMYDRCSHRTCVPLQSLNLLSRCYQD